MRKLTISAILSIFISTALLPAGSAFAGDGATVTKLSLIGNKGAMSTRPVKTPPPAPQVPSAPAVAPGGGPVPALPPAGTSSGSERKSTVESHGFAGRTVFGF